MHTTSLPPDQICGYRIVRALKAGETFLALEPQGRQVVLKKLDDDCLLQGQLHPSIKERLARVRELPHLGTANLFGVERDEHGAFAVWEYLPGEEIGVVTQSPSCKSTRLNELLRELVLAVESLHAQGLVHGAIKSGNVIVDPFDRVKLTHISPLLYNDPAEDEQAVLRLLEEILQKRQQASTRLGEALQASRQSNHPLRALAGQLATLTHGAVTPDRLASIDQEGRVVRQHAIVGAILLFLVGAAITCGVWWWITRQPY